MEISTTIYLSTTPCAILYLLVNTNNCFELLKTISFQATGMLTLRKGRDISTKDRHLLQVLSYNNYSHLANGYVLANDPRKLTDLLDFFTSNGISTQTCLLESSYDLSSDQTPVILNVATTVLNKLVTRLSTLIGKRLRTK